jgi:hypothetical protein
MLLHQNGQVTTVSFVVKLLDEKVKIVNFIKSRQLNSGIFSALWNEISNNYTMLLLHTEVSWLS